MGEYVVKGVAMPSACKSAHRSVWSNLQRVVGKRSEAKAATAPPKAKSKPLTEKDNKKLSKTVKEQGKQRAKKKAVEAAKEDKQK